MTFEERIDRLTQRHEALAESVEMLRDRTAETAANIDRLEQKLELLEENVEQFRAVTQLNFDRLTTAMLGLTEHVPEHHRRLTNLEQHP